MSTAPYDHIVVCIDDDPASEPALQEAARARGLPVAALAAEIDKTRGDRNLSSAIRVWLLKRLSGGPTATETAPVPEK